MHGFFGPPGSLSRESPAASGAAGARVASGLWRKMPAFLGPGYLVAVGYMDPGNWATNLAAGSGFGYGLLWVVLLSNGMAIVLQSLAARLGIATGKDLAQACREYYSRPMAYMLWVLCELAICACDLAELIGTAIALNLLFGLPLVVGIVLTAADVLVILLLQQKGFRFLEAFIISLVALVGICFAIEMVLVSPEWSAVLGGYFPDSAIARDPAMLYLAAGILGATVMPHNLYLHSSLVIRRGEAGIRTADHLKLATADVTLALVVAFFINSAILILAAATFHESGATDVTDIRQAHALLAPFLGVTIAGTAFAVALLAAGQSSTITATLAGQIVMEGFLRIRLPAWARRMLSRLVAIVPALVVAVEFGDAGIAQLLVFSQVVLSLQLPFAIVPLIHFTASRRVSGALKAPIWLTGVASAIAATIIALNLKVIADMIS